MLSSAAALALSTVAALALLLLSPGPKGFDPQSCARLRSALSSHVFGQDLATTQFASAVCDHLWGMSEEKKPLKPLVLSIHGPPGVGKSFTHFVAAKALYNVTSKTSECPGRECSGYRVVYGLDYTLQEKEEQSEVLVRKLMEHLSAHQDALVVIEEYDKLDCKSRGVLKQIFDKGFAMNVTLQRSIFLLESNLGYGKVVEALASAGGQQEQVNSETLQYTLKNMMFSLWQSDKCEDRVDTVKSLSLIDMFVPYFPLDESAILLVIEKAIEKRVELVNKCRKRPIEVLVGKDVLRLLAGKIEWDGEYAVEGAKEVATVIRRHVFAPLYKLTESEEEESEDEKTPGSEESAIQFLFEIDSTGKRVHLTRKRVM